MRGLSLLPAVAPCESAGRLLKQGVAEGCLRSLPWPEANVCPFPAKNFAPLAEKSHLTFRLMVAGVDRNRASGRGWGALEGEWMISRLPPKLPHVWGRFCWMPWEHAGQYKSKNPLETMVFGLIGFLLERRVVEQMGLEPTTP